jgi:hypothetical protein
MARRDVCTRSAGAPPVAEDMLLRLAITLMLVTHRCGSLAQLMVGLCVCVRMDLECVRRAGLSDEENRQADQQNPAWKHELCPTLLGGCHQKNQSHQVSRYETQRGRAEVRSPTVLTDSVNTAAIRMA